MASSVPKQSGLSLFAEETTLFLTSSCSTSPVEYGTHDDAGDIGLKAQSSSLVVFMIYFYIICIYSFFYILLSLVDIHIKYLLYDKAISFTGKLKKKRRFLNLILGVIHFAVIDATNQSCRVFGQCCF